MFIDDDIMPYKKKKKKTIKKSNHKHVYKFCVIQYPWDKFDKEKGFLKEKTESLAKYCPVCGKLQTKLTPDDWDKLTEYKHFTFSASMFWLPYVEDKYLTEYAISQINPETRTIPTFEVESSFATQVNINQTGENYD